MKGLSFRSSFGTERQSFHSIYNGIGILREIAEGKYQSKIQLGDGEGFMILTDKDIEDIKKYLDVCEKAGVFDQEELKKAENKFRIIIRVNP